MADVIYTLGAWRVKPGREQEFIDAWKGLSTVFRQLPMPPDGTATLVQSLNDPFLFYSFGSWPSLESVKAMRQDAGAQQGIRKVAELCTESTPGSFRVAAVA